MFERLVVRRQSLVDPANPIDLGFLAEAMLFYGEVALVANRTVVQQLVRSCGADVLALLLEGGHLQLLVPENLVGVQTVDSGTPRERHQLTRVELRRSPNDTEPLSIDHAVVADDFISAIGRQGRGRRVARRVAGLARKTQIHQRVAEQATIEFRDPVFLTSTVLEILRVITPAYVPPSDAFLLVEDDGTGWLSARTNLDLVGASKNALVSSDQFVMTPAYLLSLIVAAREATDGAAVLNAELACDAISARLVQRTVAHVVERRTNSEKALAQFIDLKLANGRAVREAINSGLRSFGDLLILLDRAHKFRDWLRDKPSDADLVKEYFRAITAETWADRLPAKFIRWTVFTGIGLTLDLLGAGGVGTAIGVGFSAADQFLFDQLTKGWRPSQFVNGPLKEFAEPNPR